MPYLLALLMLNLIEMRDSGISVPAPGAAADKKTAEEP